MPACWPIANVGYRVAALTCAALACGALMFSCARSDTAICANGLRCPLGKVCAASGDVCIDILGCGDGVQGPDETCDDGNIEPGDGCSATCQQEVCNNGVADPGELCDGAALAGLTCTGQGYDYGHVLCLECMPSPSSCRGFSWSPMATGTDQTLRAVWGDVQNIFVAGDDGVLLRYQNGVWLDDRPENGDDQPHTVHALAGMSDGVLAVGDACTVWRRGPEGWQAKQLVPDCGSLRGLWSDLDERAWAVGENATALYYDGRDWTAIDHQVSDQTLHGVWGVSADEIVAVGAGGTILHFDNGVWTAATSPVANDLYAVWGRSADDVFAVGAAGAVLHYDGATWTQEPPASANDLRAVWGNGNTVYAAGARGDIAQRTAPGWQLMDSAASDALLAGWSADNGKQVLAVGALGGVWRLHEDAWNSEPLADRPALGSPLVTDVWARSADDVFAVGANRVILHHDGTGWQLMDTPTLPVQASLSAIWGIGDDVFAVGSHGTILHYGADQLWTAMASGTTAWLRDVAGRSADEVYAVGDDSTILAYADGGWQLLAPLPEDEPLGHLRGLFVGARPDVATDGGVTPGATVVYLVSERGVFQLGQSDALWTDDASGRAPLAIWGPDVSQIFVVGERGLLVEYNGATWNLRPTPSLGDLTAIHGTLNDNFYIAGQRGTLAHCDQIDCAPIRAPAGTGAMQSLWTLDRERVLLLDEYGTVHRVTLDWPPPPVE